MRNFFELLQNTGTGWMFWLNVLILLVGLFFIFMILKSGYKFYRAYNLKDLDGGREIRKRGRNFILTFVVGTIFFFAVFAGFGSGVYEKETVPATNHSLNVDIMQADSMLTNEEIEKDAINNMDRDLKVFREDSIFDKELKKSEEETDAELERLLK